MRTTYLFSLSFAASSLVLAAPGKFGFSLGDKNSDGSCKQTSDYESDFDVLSNYTNLVRLYSASDCNSAQNIIPAAKSMNFSVVLGVWPDTDESFNADTNALKTYIPGNENVVEAITVGSETLYRGNFTGQQLLDKINQVKGMLPGLEVGTADSWNKYADGTADPLITGGVTYLLANAFAYWQGAPAGPNATSVYMSDMDQAIQHVKQVAGDNARNIRIINGETGWPTTGGSNYGPAIASTANAENFYQNAVCRLLGQGVDVFYFEAFDEPWKPASIGDNGQAEDETHWGFFTAERRPKFSGKC